MGEEQRWEDVESFVVPALAVVERTLLQDRLAAADERFGGTADGRHAREGVQPARDSAPVETRRDRAVGKPILGFPVGVACLQGAAVVDKAVSVPSE